MLIDTHSHIYLPDFNNDIDNVIKRAVQNSVKQILLPNIDSSTVSSILELTKKYPNVCVPMMGLHPTSVKQDYKKELDKIIGFFEENKFVAVGEIGIDLYWDKTYKKEQEEVFSLQIELAKKKNLPIVIHARDSFSEIFNILDNLYDENLTGVFHSFTGNYEQALKALSYNFKLGIGGILTFKNSGLGKTIEKVDLSNIILETDSPYLAPVPKRGKRNESSYLIYTAEKLAEIHSTTFDNICEITSKNAIELFNLKIN